jgi:hypothetical protein
MQWPWFAIAFALYPLLHIAAANPGQVEAPSLALVAGATVLIAVALLLLLRAALGGWLRAALGVTWFVLLFFAYGPLNAWIGGLGGVPEETLDTTASWSDGKLQLVHSALWALLLLLGWAMLRRLKGDGGRLPGALNLASVLLLGFALVQWLAGSGREDTLAPTRVPPEHVFVLRGNQRPTSQLVEQDLATGRRRVLVDWPALNYDLAYSPDGEEVAFASNITGEWVIYRQRISDGRAWRLTFGDGPARYPDYRPRAGPPTP